MNRELGFCADITTNKGRKCLDLGIFKANHIGEVWSDMVCVCVGGGGGGGPLSNSAYGGLELV